VFTPVRRDEDLAWVQLRTNLHPLVVLGVRAAKKFQISKVRRHVLAKMASIFGTVLVKVFEVRAEEVRRVGTLQAELLRVILEEVDIESELVACIRRGKPERTFLSLQRANRYESRKGPHSQRTLALYNSVKKFPIVPESL